MLFSAFIKKSQELVPEEIPSPVEQDTARAYCLYHELYRPKTCLKTIVKWIVGLECLTIAVSFMLCVMFNHFGISFQFMATYSSVGLVFAIACLKKICIMLIELYQHYAPEAIRRKCILMPTCSEYALLALQKYGVVIGLYKTYIRLTQKCKGDIYSINYP